MKYRNIVLFASALAVVSAFASCSSSRFDAEAEEMRIVATAASLSEEVVKSDISVQWESPVLIAANPAVYGRVHVLNDTTLMACYSTSKDAYIKFSSDKGATWAGAKCIFEHYTLDSKVVKIDNPDFAQLSSSNPYKPGRIIYAVNERVRTEDDKDAFPYYISVLTSDDAGETWSKPVQIYSSSEYAGCYEPFVLELPDGTVQVYFADESPYASASGIGDQNITVVESRDGGETWGKARVASYTKDGRDGMPSATVYDGNIYLAVEYRKPWSNEDFHPVVVYNSVSDNWTSPVGDFADGTPRFDPFQTSLQPESFYNGALYITQTDNYFLISYQTNRTPSGLKNNDHSDLEIQLCAKSEMVNGEFTTMRSASRPAGIDMAEKYANWNSVNGIGGDEVMAVFCTDGAVYGVKGKVVLPRFKFNYTKAGIEESDSYAYNISWKSDDAIVLNGVTSTKQSSSVAGDEYVEFTLPNMNADEYCALYPASAYVEGSFSGNAMTVNIPQTQNYVEGDVDPDALLMYAYSRGKASVFSFRQAMSFLKINVNANISGNVKNITVLDRSGAPLSGKFTLGFGYESSIEPQNASSEGGSIIYDCGSEGAPQGTEMLIAIPARTYSEGISLTVNINDIVTTTTCGAFTAEGGRIYSTGVNLDI